MMRWQPTIDGTSGYWKGERISLAWRGFTIRPFIRRQPIMVGSTRLYVIGPIALFVGPASPSVDPPKEG